MKTVVSSMIGFVKKKVILFFFIFLCKRIDYLRVYLLYHSAQKMQIGKVAEVKSVLIIILPLPIKCVTVAKNFTFSAR